MKDVWNNIRKELSAQALITAESLNSQADVNEIRELERITEYKLPTSFIDYLNTFNGQTHNNYEITFIGYNCLLPIREIIEEWKMLVQLFEDEPTIDFIKENKVQPKCWDKGWIPFACFEADTRLVLDMNPGKNGIEGQILQIWGGQDLESDEVVITDSFEEFSQKILEELKSKAFQIEDGVIILNEGWLI